MIEQQLERIAVALEKIAWLQKPEVIEFVTEMESPFPRSSEEVLPEPIVEVKLTAPKPPVKKAPAPPKQVEVIEEELTLEELNDSIKKEIARFRELGMPTATIQSVILEIIARVGKGAAGASQLKPEYYSKVLEEVRAYGR